MRKRTRRTMCAIIACILLLSAVPSGMAVTMSPMASYYFDSYSITLSNREDNRISVVFSVTGIMTSEELGVTNFKMQKLVSGTWTDVGGWQAGSIGTNTVDHTFSKNYYGVIGDTYRVYAIFTCTNTNGTGTKSIYSASLTCS